MKFFKDKKIKNLFLSLIIFFIIGICIISDKEYLNRLRVSIRYFSISILFLITGICIVYLIQVLIKKIGSGTAKLENIILNNFSEEIGYYREIIKNYSPSSLSFLYNLEITKRELYVELLSLEMKKKILLEDNIIIISNNKDGLTNVELYTYNSIINGKAIFNKEQFSEKIYEEEMQKGLTYLPNNNSTCSKKLWILIGLLGLLCFCAIESSSSSNSLPYFEYATPIIVIGIVIILAIIIVYLFCHGYEIKRSLLNIRTRKGNEIYKKLLGLNNYIEDFSNLDESKQKELQIWEEYLIYSVMFNNNINMNEDINKYISD